MFQIISGILHFVSGTQNLEHIVPNTAHKNCSWYHPIIGNIVPTAVSCGSIRPADCLNHPSWIEVCYLSSECKGCPLIPRILKQVISSSWLSMLFLKDCYKCQSALKKDFKKRYATISTKLDLRITNTVNSLFSLIVLKNKWFYNYAKIPTGMWSNFRTTVPQ